MSLVEEVEFLISKYDKGDEKVEYIDEMKPSVHKSLQMFLSRLTESRVYQRIIEQTHPVPHEILTRRKEIENKLSKLLEKTKSDFDVDDVKGIIYNEDGQDALTHAITMFDTGKGEFEIGEVLETLNDAWNYFPHRVMGGLSPIEKALEMKQISKISGKTIN